jgi:hypothetical protein
MADKGLVVIGIMQSGRLGRRYSHQLIQKPRAGDRGGLHTLAEREEKEKEKKIP